MPNRSRVAFKPIAKPPKRQIELDPAFTKEMIAECESNRDLEDIYHCMQVAAIVYYGKEMWLPTWKCLNTAILARRVIKSRRSVCDSGHDKMIQQLVVLRNMIGDYMDGRGDFQEFLVTGMLAENARDAGEDVPDWVYPSNWDHSLHLRKKEVVRVPELVYVANPLPVIVNGLLIYPAPGWYWV
jgi:hypothetical protein